MSTLLSNFFHLYFSYLNPLQFIQIRDYAPRFFFVSTKNIKMSFVRRCNIYSIIYLTICHFSLSFLLPSLFVCKASLSSFPLFLSHATLSLIPSLLCSLSPPLYIPYLPLDSLCLLALFFLHHLPILSYKFLAHFSIFYSPRRKGYNGK